MTFAEIGTLISLFLTILGWSITAYYQRRILERQIKADQDKLAKQFAHEKELIEIQYKQKIKELEQQALLNLETESVHQLSERRLTVYPKIVELVYRVRNLARAIAENLHSVPILTDELIVQMNELEDKLFANRMDLERDGVFDSIHTYKNTVTIFIRINKDLGYYLSRQDTGEANRVFSEMASVYFQIEEQHKPLIISLSKLYSITQNNKNIPIED